MSAVYRIAKQFTFDAAHVLADLPAGHKCARLHGHTWTVEAELSGSGLAPPGFVADFGDLAPLRRYIDEHFDHRHLNEVLDVPPTSENLARHFFTWCAGHLELPPGARVTAARVSESPRAWAEYRAEAL